MSIDPRAKIYAAINVSRCGGDCSEIAGAMLQRIPTLLNELVDKLVNGEEFVFIPEHQYGRNNDELHTILGSLTLNQSLGFRIYLKSEEIDLTVKLLEPMNTVSDGNFWMIPDNATTDPVTFFGCLATQCAKRGFALHRVTREISVGRYIGAASERDSLVTGSPIIREVGVLTAVRQDCSYGQS